MSGHDYRQCPRYFVPIFGSYYHFLNESALGLYRMLKDEKVVDTLDCKLWYQGSYVPIVQMFSRHPVVEVPVKKPYLKDASTLGEGIQTLNHIRLGLKVGFGELIPLVQFFKERIEPQDAAKGITLIRRLRKRVYAETDELASQLQIFALPVRVVQMEMESFESQVNIMRNTIVLIAPHGAGTMNQIFMPRGGIVIELFPMGYSNWHAKAVADVFGHRLVEFESKQPGVFGREPSEAICDWITANGWPDRTAVNASRRHSEELLRIVRDVSSYSIDPAAIVLRLQEMIKDSHLK